MKLVFLLVTTIIFGVASIDASARNTIKWKSVGNWNILVDPTLGNGCYLTASYESGTSFRFGFALGERPQFYVILHDPDWKSIEEGKEYDISLRFDERKGWAWTAQGTRLSDGEVVLYGGATSSDFFSELARSHVLFATYKRQVIASLQLKGSFAASRELLKCHDAMKATGATGRKARRDPFASETAPRRVRDPFAR